MSKYPVCIAILLVLLFVVACGGAEEVSNDNDNSGEVVETPEAKGSFELQLRYTIDDVTYEEHASGDAGLFRDPYRLQNELHFEDAQLNEEHNGLISGEFVFHRDSAEAPPAVGVYAVRSWRDEMLGTSRSEVSRNITAGEVLASFLLRRMEGGEFNTGMPDYWSGTVEILRHEEDVTVGEFNLSISTTMSTLHGPRENVILELTGSFETPLQVLQ